MRTILTLLVLAAAGVLCAPALADDLRTETLTIRKGRHTTIIKLDPASAEMIRKAMREGRKIRINTPAPVSQQAEHKGYCDRACRIERARINGPAESAGYIAGKIIGD